MKVAVAAALGAVAAACVLVGARVVRREVDAHGVVVEDYAPDRTGACAEFVSCLPAGTATTVTQGLVLVAAVVPVLVGLILGIPLSRPARGRLVRALAFGAVCTAAVAVTFRLTAARYAILLDHPAWDLLREVHKNSVAFMVMQTVFLIALGAVLGRNGRRRPYVLVTCLAAWPVALVAAQVGGLVLAMLAALLTAWSDPLSMMLGTLTEDGTAAFAALVLAGCTVVTVLAGRRRIA